jgi:hypothetical protein
VRSDQQLWLTSAEVQGYTIKSASLPTRSRDQLSAEGPYDMSCCFCRSFKQSWMGYHDLPPMMRQFHKDGTFSTGEDDPWSDVQYKSALLPALPCTCLVVQHGLVCCS